MELQHSETITINIDDYIEEIKEHYGLVEEKEEDFDYKPILDELLDFLEKRGQHNLVKEVKGKIQHGYKHRLEDLVKC